MIYLITKNLISNKLSEYEIELEEMQLVNCLSMGVVTLPTGIIGNQTEQYNQEKSRKVSL